MSEIRFGGGYSAGKAYLRKKMMELALDAGQTVLVVGPKGCVTHKRYKRNGRTFDVLTPHKPQTGWVSIGELGKR